MRLYQRSTFTKFDSASQYELIVQGSLVSNYSLIMNQISTTSNKPTNRGEFKEVISQINRFIPNFTQSICKELEE